MDKRYLTTEPVFGDCSFSAADLDGKKLKWKLPSSAEVDGAEASEILCSEQDGRISVALRDSIPGPHLDSDGQPIPINLFGLWLTEEGLKLLKSSESGQADFEAIAPDSEMA